MEQNFPVFCKKFLELHESRTPIVVVTLTEIVGHAPQDVGARMIVGLDGPLFGTVGGGKVEKKCIDKGIELLTTEGSAPHQAAYWNLQRDVGMSCGGEVGVFFEVFRPERAWQIALFGAGHIVQVLAPLLLTMDCYLTVIDPRAEWLAKLADHPRLKKIETQDMPSVIPTLDESTFVGIITMGHPTDYPIVKRALETRNFPYLGVIGSKVKRIKINADLVENGMSVARTKEFFCPMGEDIGRNTPAEISISIIAQMLRVRDALYGKREASFVEKLEK